MSAPTRDTKAVSRPLVVLAAVLAAVVLADLLVTVVVFADRRNDARAPRFQQADVGSVRWDVPPYADGGDQLGFTVTPGAPATVSSSGRVTYRNNTLNPALSASYSVAALARYRETQDERWLERAEQALLGVLERAPDGRLPYGSPDTDPFGARLPVPGFSAAAQGLMLSAMAGLYDETGDPRWRTESHDVFAALYRFKGFFAGDDPAPEPWFSLVDGDGFLWFEHFTYGRAPARVMTDQIYALLGIYDYRRSLADEPRQSTRATRLFAGGLATVQKNLAQVRLPGQLSYFSISARSQSSSGHQVLQQQLQLLARITGEQRFREVAAALDADDDLAPFTVADISIADADVDVYSPLSSAYGYTTAPPEPAVVTESGQVTFRDGEINPGLSASYALAALDEHRRTGDPAWLSRAESAVLHAMRTADGGLLPYRFVDSDALGVRLDTPWYSAQGQGLMLSALVRLARTTGEARWRMEAKAVYETLQRFRDFGADGAQPPRPWISLVDDSGYLWFEQFPTGSAPSLVVNVQLTAVLAVYEYWQLTRDPVARTVFAGGAATLSHYLPLIRKPGRAPWYSLATKDPDARYDDLVDRQLATLARITGDEAIRRYAER